MPAPTNSPDARSAESRTLVVVSFVSAAVFLTFTFWGPLWRGGGLVGSDIYAYVLPQKAYFADCLRAGTLPLWNHLVGHGYPQVAESQTGVFYPLHWALYPWLPLNTAFSASTIAHYVLAFMFAAMYARRIGLTVAGATLAALVYTYGWFPPRVCLEWSIIGGAWFPLALWCVEAFLQLRYWRFAFLLTATLAVQMLAGHFVLAFITQLSLVLYVPLRLWFAPRDLPAETIASRRALIGWSVAAVLCAFLVAAVQLFPTWELKQHSQRRGVTEEHDPGYGYIPPKYLTQIVAPWLWYSDEASFHRAMTPGGSRTNRVEAHLYFGMAPLLLAAWGACRAIQIRDRRRVVWMILGLAAMVYTTGCLLPVTKHLPGFSFFEGPGRFGIVTTLAAGMLAGSGLVELDRSIPAAVRWLLSNIAPSMARRAASAVSVFARLAAVLVIFAWTVFDLHHVSREVTYAALVAHPPANDLAQSPLRKFFAELPQPSRIFSAGKNLPSLLGVATVPTYLGLGPEQYFDPACMLPQPWPLATPPTPEQLDWFHRAGVTHFLSFEPADAEAWFARQVWEGPDLFLNRALGRPADAKFFLYELAGGRGRVAWAGERNSNRSATITQYGFNEVAISAESPQGGMLILTDLSYPGWRVAVDGQPAGSESSDGMYRAVQISVGKHAINWTYRPASLYWGGAISVSVSLILLALGHVRYWHPQLLACA